jgi:Flp pilus assembly secretin CpaC
MVGMMEARSAGAHCGAIAAILMLLCLSCTPHKSELSPEFKKRVEAMGKNAGQAVQEDIAKETIPPGAEPPPPTGFMAVEPGQDIWIQSGKARTLRLRENISRVSVANPEVAGIVVLGPRTIMINGKPLPAQAREEQHEEFGGGLQLGRSGTVLGRTLTQPPNLAETTVTYRHEYDDALKHNVLLKGFFNKR